MPLLDISCTNCGCKYPLEGLPYRCLQCNGIFDIPLPLPYDSSKVDWSQPGIWRYRHTFGLPDGVEAISLGEGCTPLLWTRIFSREVAFKCEFLNPTGSFKDRGSAVIAGWLKSRHVLEAVEDSSGNAGASFAAYAARSGIRARIFIPESASGPKRKQIEAFGAELIPVGGARTAAAEEARKAAEGGLAYASHAYLPFNLPGYATAAYEIYEQLNGRMPGSVVIPVGQGGLLLGLFEGFEALRQNYATTRMPKMLGVQARACAPLWALSTYGNQGLGLVSENPTLAEGVRVRFPVRGDIVLKAMQMTTGFWIAVDEEMIPAARDALAHLGFYVEYTSAIVWPALEKTIRKLPDPVVVILTGSGYKCG